ncbi:MAG: hypothetical protein AAGA11_07355 [Pseudomonadota bacterium]
MARRSDSEWVSITDMMAGLMMVFMLIAIGFMWQVQQEKNAISEIAVAYDESRTALNRALIEEFADDLPRWDAEILPDNTVRFREPDVLFDVNSASIKPAFRTILDDFFPRYIGILERPAFQTEVSEIRIEGHTSSDWQGASDPGEVYIKNAKLSQDRSFSVLDYVFSLQAETGGTRDWLVSVLRANGLSYAVPVLHADGREDSERSRRVEFRVLTRTEDKIYRILQQAGDAA